ncbi:MAG: hypothetical protein KKD07_01590 [Candidatus Omnitrophica bacterium]|nr:hypothetical protein [Candidatus Omnitrophota bacterium]MBU1997352.1 hypothetical protein [Candidatus Omnitrophota bacterium]MBU4333114.1 hypothetical protein [Candidatus Omnitrophota bacterium]
MNNIKKVFLIFMAAPVLMIVILIIGMKIYFNPNFYNFQGEKREEKNLKKLLGSYVTLVSDLNCTCIDCHPASDGVGRICGFKTSKDNLKNIVQGIGLSERMLSEKESSLYKGSGLLPFYQYDCEDRGPFTNYYFNTKEQCGEIMVIFYDEKTQNVCVGFDYGGLG